MQLGFDAAASLVMVKAGTFHFEPTLETPDATIEASVTQLLLEASRLQDEADLETDEGAELETD